MNSSVLQLYGHDLNNISRLFITSIVLVSSIVIADQNIPLDLDLALDSANVENILDRKDWRESTTEQESNWRQKPAQSSPEYTWGAISIYEDNKELEPIIPGVNEPSSVVDIKEAAPKFQLRF